MFCKLTFSSNVTPESWEILASDADDDDSEWEETFSKLGIGETALRENSSKPIDIQSNGLSRGQRYRSSDQEFLLPKSVKASTAWETFRPKDEDDSERSHARLARRVGVVQRQRSKSI